MSPHGSDADEGVRGRSADLCVCGHPRGAHEHYRRGTDCGVCGAAVCGRFRPAR